MTNQEFDKIVKRYQNAVLSIAYRMVFSWEVARDIAQDTFLKLWLKQETFKMKKPVYPFLIRIAMNKSIDFLRRKKEGIADPDCFTQSNTDNMDDKEISEILLKCTASLKPKQRAVFILRDIEGLTYGEISEILKTNLHNIRSNLHLARKNIKELLFNFFQINEEFFYEM